jgi:hypothetical protein
MREVFKNTYQEIINGIPVSNIDKIISFLIKNGDQYTSKWHALGFIHCEIASFTQGSLRLHIWPSQDRHSQEQIDKIHDHIFSLTSLVLCGTIKNDTYTVDEVSKSEASNQSYKVKYQPNSAELQATGNYFKKTLKHQDEIKKNESYTVLAGDFHQSTVTDGTFVATIVATYDHVKLSPRLLGSIDRSESIVRDYVVCEKTRWLELLAYIEVNLKFS